MRRTIPMFAVLLLAAPLTCQDEKPPEGPVVGQPAPAFRLNDHEGTAVEVGGAGKNWTVVAFFPKAATPG